MAFFAGGVILFFGVAVPALFIASMCMMAAVGDETAQAILTGRIRFRLQIVDLRVASQLGRAIPAPVLAGPGQRFVELPQNYRPRHVHPRQPTLRGDRDPTLAVLPPPTPKAPLSPRRQHSAWVSEVAWNQ